MAVLSSLKRESSSFRWTQLSFSPICIAPLLKAQMLQRPEVGQTLVCVSCHAMRGPFRGVSWESHWFIHGVGDVADSLSQRSPAGFSSPTADRCQLVIVLLSVALPLPLPIVFVSSVL